MKAADLVRRGRERRLVFGLVAGVTLFQALALLLGGGWADWLPPDQRYGAAAAPVLTAARAVPDRGAAPAAPAPAAGDARDQAPPWSFDADGNARLVER